MPQLHPAPPTFLPLPPHDGPELFGTLLVEVVTPDGNPSAPDLADWEVRAWPVARLGDATLEARPRAAQRGAADLDAHTLDAQLRRAGYLPLGPFRAARSRPG